MERFNWTTPKKNKNCFTYLDTAMKTTPSKIEMVHKFNFLTKTQLNAKFFDEKRSQYSGKIDTPHSYFGFTSIFTARKIKIK